MANSSIEIQSITLISAHFIYFVSYNLLFKKKNLSFPYLQISLTEIPTFYLSSEIHTAN